MAPRRKPNKTPSNIVMALLIPNPPTPPSPIVGDEDNPIHILSDSSDSIYYIYHPNNLSPTRSAQRYMDYCPSTGNEDSTSKDTHELVRYYGGPLSDSDTSASAGYKERHRGEASTQAPLQFFDPIMEQISNSKLYESGLEIPLDKVFANLNGNLGVEYPPKKSWTDSSESAYLCSFLVHLNFFWI